MSSPVHPGQTSLALVAWGAFEAALWDYLRENARGRSAAISRKELAEAFGMDVREISAKVKDLIERHGKLIGTDSAGIWIPASEEEAETAMENIRHRFVSLAKRYAVMKKMGEEEFSKQMLLWLKEEEGHRD